MINWWKSISCRHKYERVEKTEGFDRLFLAPYKLTKYRCAKCGVTKTIYR